MKIKIQKSPVSTANDMVIYHTVAEIELFVFFFVKHSFFSCLQYKRWVSIFSSGGKYCVVCVAGKANRVRLQILLPKVWQEIWFIQGFNIIFLKESTHQVLRLGFECRNYFGGCLIVVVWLHMLRQIWLKTWLVITNMITNIITVYLQITFT